MSYMKKPRVNHPKLARNDLGLARSDYEGGMSTLCAGCGHDSITASIITAAFELSIPPENFAKLSGIGCSSKTTAYFMGASHGFNAVHGRMPCVATGANAANPDLKYIGVSGDGDSLSIGMGQFSHVIRRNLNMVYLIENNGVYGLTKGQFSASADIGTKAKKGETNQQPPIDPVNTAITFGATFVARSFSGDKQQLIPLIKAALNHKGFALIDVLSPCVTFNDHEDSTKSYTYTRQYYHPAIHTDFISQKQSISAHYKPGEATTVALHDGSQIVLRKTDKSYDPEDRVAALKYIQEKQRAGEYLTGLLYIDEKNRDFHEVNGTVKTPLNQVPYEDLCPGSDALNEIISRYR